MSREFTYSNGAWQQTDEKRRVFDGLDVIQERNAANEVTAQLVRDGNIGGILARSTQAGATFFGYDGGGNVTLLTDENGDDVGRYRYDAFGNTLEASGSRAAENPYRFSTKELHGASGLYDFGFRFYSASLGRWINRDPIAEAGGVNLYAMVGNSPTNSVDAYGLLGVAVQVPIYGRNFTLSTPGYGRGGPDFLFDKSSADNLGQDVEKGWYPAADGLNPLGDPYKDMGYWDPCDDNSQWSYNLGVVSQQSMVTAGSLGISKLYTVPKYLYHFTGAEGGAAINATGVIRAGSGFYGRGVYLTRFTSPLLARLQGARETTAMVRVATEGLNVRPTLFPGTFRVPTNIILR